MKAWRLGNWCFSPGLWPTVAALLMLPILAGLGMWQLDRAAQKERLQQEYDEHRQASPVRLMGDENDLQKLRYRRVTVRGQYDTEHEILLDNRVHEGQVGFYVLTPLRIAGSPGILLVNRGWVAMGPDRNVRPVTPAPDREIEVSGVVAPPHSVGMRMGAPYADNGNWPQIWQYLDLPVYSRRSGLAVQPFIVLMDPDSQAGGFVRQWARLDAGIATHHGYALTWFSLAVVLVLIYILLNLRRCAGNPT